MLFEPKIGKLIRRLNPYTNGGMLTMLSGKQPPDFNADDLATLNAVGGDLIALGNALQTYAGAPTRPNRVTIDNCEAALDAHLDIGDIPLRIDNDFHQDYMTWVFRGQAQKVKRALRVTYRYELTDPPHGRGAPTGIFATEHVLIGYAGANG